MVVMGADGMSRDRGRSPRRGRAGVRVHETDAVETATWESEAEELTSWEEEPRQTAVRPAITLPTRAVIPSAGASTPRHPSLDAGEYGEYAEHEYFEYGENGEDDVLLSSAPQPERGPGHQSLVRVPISAAPLPKSARLPATATDSPSAIRSRIASLSRQLIPGRPANWSLDAKPSRIARAAPEVASSLRRHRALLTAITLVAVIIGILADTAGIGTAVGLPPLGKWLAVSGQGPAPTPPPPPAPSYLDTGHYVNVYGFDYPSNIRSLPTDERQRLSSMLPYAISATAAYDARYGARIEPELVVWWTHSEGIEGHINYSNCANNGTRPGTNYFSDIENCPQSSFWQLGYGNQFSVIYILRNAFADTHGNPEDPKLVQRVGQWVLNFDRSQGTVPTCGGYACTFPAMTIDQIMSGIDETTGVTTADNWWASVLSRDPAINCYMIAHALTFFNHAATRNWVGCYYFEPCWGNESDRLGDILAAWPSLRQMAGV
jgi:hypothetical protein